MFLRRLLTARRSVHTAWPVVLVNRSSGSVVRLASVVIVVDMRFPFWAWRNSPRLFTWGGVAVVLPPALEGRQLPASRGAPGQGAARGVDRRRRRAASLTWGSRRR